MERDVSLYGSLGEQSRVVAEQARLIEQAGALTRAEGLLSCYSREELEEIHDVVDIACGPGGWVLDVAQAYPWMTRVVGVDISQSMINYAQLQAETSGLDSAQFHVMDILHPLNLPDDSFDLVNARFLIGVVPRAKWLDLLLELRRITRPGGLIRITENENGLTTSAACEQLGEIIAQSFHAGGFGFSPTGKKLGITPVLERLLQDAKLSLHSVQTYSLNYGWGTPSYQTWKDISIAGIEFLRPFVAKLNLLTIQEFDAVCARYLREMDTPDFSALLYIRSASARKPYK